MYLNIKNIKKCFYGGYNFAKRAKDRSYEGNPGLAKILIGLGCDTTKYSGGSDLTRCFRLLLDKNGKATVSRFFIYTIILSAKRLSKTYRG
jgi:hypothetical protein